MFRVWRWYTFQSRFWYTFAFPATAVVAQTVIGRDTVEPAFEGVVQARDLVPSAQIFLDLEIIDGLDVFGNTHATRDAKRQQQAKCFHFTLHWEVDRCESSSRSVALYLQYCPPEMPP